MPDPSKPSPSQANGPVTFGIDMGGTNLRVAAFDSAWNRLTYANLPTRVSDGPNAVVSDMADAIHQALEQCGPGTQLFGVGVGAPGPLELPAGKFLRPPNLPGFDQFCLRRAGSETKHQGGNRQRRERSCARRVEKRRWRKRLVWIEGNNDLAKERVDVTATQRHRFHGFVIRVAKRMLDSARNGEDTPRLCGGPACVRT